MAGRNENSRWAVLEATSELLADSTIQALSIEAIAKRAGVGKTTIYRWWPSKSAVVIDAFMEHHLIRTKIPQGVPVREALLTHLISLIEQYAGQGGQLVAQIIAESQYDERTLRAFRERFWDRRRADLLELVERGIRDGELDADIDPALMVELIYSPVYVRLLLNYRELDRRFAEEVVDAAFAGLAGWT